MRSSLIALLFLVPPHVHAQDTCRADEMQELYNLHGEFAQYLHKHGIELHDFPDRQSLIEDGDIRPANMIFSAKLAKWILYNP